MTIESISLSANIILIYIIMVISPSIFLGRLVSWYLWRKNVVNAKNIIGGYDKYLIVILLVVLAKFSNISFSHVDESKINSSIFVYIISFLIPILITKYFIDRKNKYVINESFKLDFSIQSLKFLIFISSIPVLALYVCFVLSNHGRQDLWNIIITYPLLITLFCCDLVETSYKTIKFLNESIKIKYSTRFYYEKRQERNLNHKKEEHISENGKFKSLTDILVDENNWNPIYIDYLDKKNTVSIEWEFKNKDVIDDISDIQNAEMIGPFFKPSNNLLNLLSDSEWKSEKYLPKTKVEHVLSKGRKIKFNVRVLISTKDQNKSFVSWDFDIKDSFLHTFYYNFQDTYKIFKYDTTLSETYNTLEGVRLASNGGNFIVKDKNGTSYTLSYDLLYKKDLVYLSVNH